MLLSFSRENYSLLFEEHPDVSQWLVTKAFFAKAKVSFFYQLALN